LANFVDNPPPSSIKRCSLGTIKIEKEDPPPQTSSSKSDLVQDDEIERDTIHTSTPLPSSAHLYQTIEVPAAKEELPKSNKRQSNVNLEVCKKIN